jgi:hypothetical protein
VSDDQDVEETLEQITKDVVEEGQMQISIS